MDRTSMPVLVVRKNLAACDWMGANEIQRMAFVAVRKEKIKSINQLQDSSMSETTGAR